MVNKDKFHPYHGECISEAQESTGLLMETIFVLQLNFV